MHPRELSFWEDDGNLARSADRARGSFLLARQVFARSRHSLRLLTEADFPPGISMVPRRAIPQVTRAIELVRRAKRR